MNKDPAISALFGDAESHKSLAFVNNEIGEIAYEILALLKSKGYFDSDRKIMMTYGGIRMVDFEIGKLIERIINK